MDSGRDGEIDQPFLLQPKKLLDHEPPSLTLPVLE
jgi:hypothetical protein